MLRSVSRGALSFCRNALLMPLVMHPFYVPYLSIKSTLVLDLQVFEKSDGALDLMVLRKEDTLLLVPLRCFVQ